MNNRERIFACDFETTVYEGQTRTDVWSACFVELWREDEPVIFGNIHDFMGYFENLAANVTLFFHNLKFDGHFILNWLMASKNYELGESLIDNKGKVLKLSNKKQQNPGSYTYLISDLGQWYNIVIRTQYGYYITIKDSLKLLPFTLRQIGDAFHTSHKKLEMEYSGHVAPDCVITDEEREYIKNDVYVLKEALEYFIGEGNTGSTIGSCCLHEFKQTFDRCGIGNLYEAMFPNLYDSTIVNSKGEEINIGQWIHGAYRGGWCYLKKSCAGRVIPGGCTYDVNSLYPYVMHSASGNRYPVGVPAYFEGAIPEKCNRDEIFYFVRFSCKFEIKKNHLPFIQIKGSQFYNGNEMLETSDWIDKYGARHETYIDFDGDEQKIEPTLTMTQTDFKLFQEQYDICNLKIIDGFYFLTDIGFFDRYIDKYKKIKMTSAGARRTLAKLFSNNLYGKMAASPESSFKIAYLDTNGVIDFYDIEEYEKNPGYIAIGAAITSYARNYTIRAAQLNYDVFIYADTDSIHCACPATDVRGIRVDPVEYGGWKNETNWDVGLFVRQKTYIEQVCEENGTPVAEKYWNVKCAGMPAHCKDLFVASMTGVVNSNGKPIAKNEKEREFVSNKRDLQDFNYGLTVPGKLVPRRIPGGVLLSETEYELRK